MKSVVCIKFSSLCSSMLVLKHGQGEKNDYRLQKRVNFCPVTTFCHCVSKLAN